MLCLRCSVYFFSPPLLRRRLGCSYCQTVCFCICALVRFHIRQLIFLFSFFPFHSVSSHPPPLVQYIAEFYQEDPELYSREIYELETLRAATYNPSIDINGCNLIKRYYCQLHSLQNRFPIGDDHHLVSFSWRDIYSSNGTQSTDLKHDMAVVLYNYGVVHTMLGAGMMRTTEDEMKLACTHFQCAAWAFETVREQYGMAAVGDLCPEILIFMQQISFAQAQECILEKSLIDNRKSIITAKVTAQIIEYYNTALAALLTGGDDGIVAEIVGNKSFKEWKQYVQFKVQYMSCILLLYQGQNAEEQQKMGERVALYQSAFDRLEEARKESRGMNNAQIINEALTFVMDVVEAKRKSARNENEFIYHEEVPELSAITSVPGANLVKGIPFSVTDPTLIGEDIFHRLVPIKTHETSSLYSEEKANLLRCIGQKIDGKDAELNKFMESLNIDSLNYDASDVRLPQPLIDRCADLNAKPNAIPDLIAKMSSLAEICVDVENMLGNIQEMLNQEKEFQQTIGDRVNSHIVDLNTEFTKYLEAHSKAGGSNDTLRKAMELHVNNLKILARPLAEVQASIPVCGAEINPNALNETRHLLGKVNEMRLQRAQLFSQLNDDIQKDDITAQLIAWGDRNVDELFKAELGKHTQLTSIIEQNLLAQSNILKAFTDAYARCAHFIKAVADTKHKRDTFLSSLIASYDVYDDLLGKSLKGLEFYKKLHNNIGKLSKRVRSACEVNEEERQQRMQSLNKKAAAAAAASAASASANMNPTLASQMKAARQPQMPSASVPSNLSHHHAGNVPSTMNNPEIGAQMPKLSDYEMKYESYRNPSVRPTPIGQENTAISSACLPSIAASVAYDTKQILNASHASHIPYNYVAATTMGYTLPSSSVYNYSTPTPTPPSMTHKSGYDSSNTNNVGYVNPMYSNFSTTAATSYTPPAYYNTDDQSTNLTYGQQPSNAKRIESTNYQPSPPPSVPPPSQSPQMPISSSYSSMQYAPPTDTTQATYSNPNTFGYQDQQYQSYATHYPSASATSQVSYPQTSMPAYTYAQSNYSTSQQQSISSSTGYNNNYGAVYSQPQPQTQPQTQYMNYQQPNVAATDVTSDQMATIHSDTSFYGQNNAYYNPSVSTNTQQYGASTVQPTYSVFGGAYQYYSETPPTATAAGIQYSTSGENAGLSNMNYGPNANYNYNQPYSGASSQPTYTTSVQPPPVSIATNPTISAPAANATHPGAVAPQQTARVQPKSKIDLLSDLENDSIAAPTLQPIKSESILVPTKKEELAAPDTKVVEPSTSTVTTTTTIASVSTPYSDPLPAVAATSAVVGTNTPLTSLESELSQLSMIDSFSKIEQPIAKSTAGSTTDLSTSTSALNIEAFFKEVQRYEKAVNNLQTKTLNGTTSLALKWKELNDLLVSDI